MPDLHLYNTLHNAVQKFTPRDENNIRMYVCGPTVYGPVHIGNARPAVVFDVLYRLLKRHYPRVTYARNITDIDDKIIAAAAESGEMPQQLAARWQQRYLEDMQALGVLPPDAEPTATGAMPVIIAMIQRLIEREVAYAEAGHVLFHVPAFADYGMLSNRRRDEMIAGARVEVAPYKRDAADFVLWKPSVDGQPGWDSPWGYGRPGWHIECSAMAAACLGEEIDIHGGGQDLIFPHHENELAQSRCAHGTATFATYWVHNGHVRMDGEKMSKSLDNVLLLSDCLARHGGEVVRLALISTHYRHPLNWNDTLLAEAKAVLDKWYRVLAADEDESGGGSSGNGGSAVEDALLSDINTPAAIAALHQAAQRAQQSTDKSEAAYWRGELAAGGRLLGLFGQSAREWFQRGSGISTAPSAAQIEEKISQRLAARKARDFAAADMIRDELAAQGVLLEDSADGTRWRLG